MRVNNGKDWCRALDPNDRQYGVERLAICDQTALVRHLERHSHRLPAGIDQVFANVGRYDCYEQRELMTRFYRCYPRYYMDHVVASGVLETPVGLGGGYHTTGEVLERLKGAAPPTNYAFAVGEPADGNWSRAIAMLRERIGLSPEGGYTQEAAEKLYLYGRNRWRTGRGYLYSDNNPDILFNSGYQDYVTVVNSEVWVLAELDINFLHDDEYEIWKIPKTDPDKVMYDMHGRTTGKDMYKGEIIPTIWRILMAKINYRKQAKFDIYRLEREGKISEQERKDLLWRLNTSGDTPPLIEPYMLGIDFQKNLWSFGAEVVYAKDWILTWYLLKNSLSPCPQDVVIEEDVSYLFDEIIERIRSNDYFRTAVNEYVRNKTTSFSMEAEGEEPISLSFESYHSMDLFASIHGCKLWLSGEKNDDNSWNLDIKLTDKFDFTDLKNPFFQEVIEEDEYGNETTTMQKASPGYMLAWGANDVAHFSQEWGQIIPFDVVIHFAIKNYEVEE